MKINIRTYENLLAEETRLTKVLETKKQKLQASIDGVAEELKPAIDMVSVFRDLTIQNKENLVLNTGINILIDKLIKKGILSRAGWISRLLIPFFLKNFSSNLIAKYKDAWHTRLEELLNSKNGSHEPVKSEDAEQMQ